MNEAVKPPPTPPRRSDDARRASDVRGRDREFLPAALEILETPPAPLPVAMMLTLCAFCVAALVWSFVGRLDVHAVAWGKVEANGHAKVIQPVDAGKVVAIRVENGDTVKAGDVLLELDPAEATADEAAASGSFAASRAEIVRRRLAIDTARPLSRLVGTGGAISDAEARSLLDGRQGIVFDTDIPPTTRRRETAVLDADLSQMLATMKNLDKQGAQKAATRRRLEMSIAFQDALMKTLENRVTLREKAIALQVGTPVNLFDAQEALQKSQSQRASDQGQLIETDAALEEIASEKVRNVAQFIADNENKLAEASRKADESAQQLAKARARLAHAKLVAPLDGTVQQVAVTTIGQVVTTGQQLMTIAPANGALQVEAFVSNGDIGFVKVGQRAEIKIDAFPFTRFGTVRARVTKVASDAIDEQDAKRAQSNAIAGANSASFAPTTAPGQLQSFVFPVSLTLDSAAMQIDGVAVPLKPGMTVGAEIKTDNRRVIDYVLSPIAKLAHEAMRER